MQPTIAQCLEAVKVSLLMALELFGVLLFLVTQMPGSTILVEERP
jgi:hypothetical protein